MKICGVIIVVEAGVRYLVDTSYGFKPLARVEAVCEAQTAKIRYSDSGKTDFPHSI